jgi:glutamyl-tRNA reductase
MILGEAQILSQVKGAHQAALEAKTAGPVLDHLFKQALSCGKRVRTETSMGRRAVSVSSAALELARHTIGELKDKRVVVIGAGKMAQICVKLLLSESGTGTVFLLNRTKERISQFLKNNIANLLRLETEFDFEDRYKLAATADLVIVSTSAPGILLEREKLAVARSRDHENPAEAVRREEAPAITAMPPMPMPEHCLRALKEREEAAKREAAAAGCPAHQGSGEAGWKPAVQEEAKPALPEAKPALPEGGQKKDLCIIDISVPRNVDPDAASLPGIKLFHADDLANLVSRNLAEREALVCEAEEIVFETLDDFHAWQRSLLVVPTIAGLREKIEAIRQEHVAKTRGSHLSDDDMEPGAIEEISRAIVNQILHHPTVQLKATRDYEILRQQAEALRTLFSLDPLGAVAPSTLGGGAPRIRLVEPKKHHSQT